MKKEVSLKKEQKGFAKVIRRNSTTIAKRLLDTGELWNEEISLKLAKAASYHVVMFEGIFREEFKKAVLATPGSDIGVTYVVDKITKALRIFETGEMLFRPEGQLKEGETLDYELYHV